MFFWVLHLSSFNSTLYDLIRDWESANVLQVTKGSCSDLSNYRTKTLTSFPFKNFRSILSFLRSFGIIFSPLQLPVFRVWSQLVIFFPIQLINGLVLRDYGGSCVGATGISWAVHQVWHASLLCKLLSFEFSPLLYSLTSFFTEIILINVMFLRFLFFSSSFIYPIHKSPSRIFF